jgi:DNA-binding transcriptional MerR regulator
MVYHLSRGAKMKTYTVHQLANLAGISVRTLHHYDQIELLKPSARNQSGYRLYRQPELLRLQQILFYKELDVPLSQIKDILDQPGFDQVQALREHRRSIAQHIEQYEKLLNTIDKTIAKLTEADMELTDEELYEGLTKEQAERYPRQARERYDPKLVEETERRIRKLSKAQWQAIKQEGDEITRALAGLMDRPPEDAEVQRWVAKQHAWIEHFYPAPAELYRNLGQGYADDPEFRATYDRYRPGLADFLHAAIDYYCDHSLQ